jgi:predicted DNA-binding transcriptional regulator YafY
VTEAGLRYEAAAERRASMLATLRSVGFVSVADLARQLGVSQMTIRRDLHALENGGHVRLVHGGASLTPGALRSSGFPEDDEAEARERVAACAVPRGRDGHDRHRCRGDRSRGGPSAPGDLRRLRHQPLSLSRAPSRQEVDRVGG